LAAIGQQLELCKQLNNILVNKTQNLTNKSKEMLFNLKLEAGPLATAHEYESFRTERSAAALSELDRARAVFREAESVVNGLLKRAT
jgi:hypothetical protein